MRTANPILRRTPRPRVGSPVSRMGIEFPNLLGMAAGFDKDARNIDALATLGFGHVEIGTVTAHPQAGNPTPRLFRLTVDRAILNRMGFNNDGAEVVAARLARRAEQLTSGRGIVTRRREFVTPRRDLVTPREAGRGSVVVGVNIGKTKAVPDDEAVADYTTSARLLAPWADYLVVNVSSPNTPGLRDLQSVEKLEPLLRAVRRTADEVTAQPVPLLVKIAPDLEDDDVLAVADLAEALGLDGIIATNTTISREGLRTPSREVAELGAGGISGPPLRERSLAVLRLLRERSGPGRTLISVGGITSASDAAERLAAGADLLQAYTAFIYEGPLWPRHILRGLDRYQGRR